MAKKTKNIFNKKIDLEIDDNSHGFLYGLMIGAVVGIILSLIFKVDLGFAYGIGPGMLIGLLVDINNGKNKKSKKKTNKKKQLLEDDLMKKKEKIITISEKKAYIYSLVVSVIFSFVGSYCTSAIMMEFGLQDKGVSISNLIWILWPLLLIVFCIFSTCLIIIFGGQSKKK